MWVATRVVATGLTAVDLATVRVDRLTVFGAVVDAVFASLAGAAVSVVGVGVLVSVVDGVADVVGAVWSVGEVTGGGSAGTGWVCWAIAVVEESARTAAIAGRALARA